jgi:uncharacterized protein
VTPALHNIANAYAYGKGVSQSFSNALLYYQAASEAKDPYASFTLGTWYYHGKVEVSIESDKVKAFSLFQQAALQQHPLAMFNVGVAYLTGEGTTINRKLAVEWLQAASIQGNLSEARLNLAKIYMEGIDWKTKQYEDAKDILLPIRYKHPMAALLWQEIEKLEAQEKKL